jgi:hypothetical protein
MEDKMFLFSICVDAIPPSHVKTGKDGKVYLNNLILAKKKEVDQFGQDVTIFASQTKEQRDANEKRSFVGNGKTIK